MTLTAICSIILGALQFPKEVLALINALKSTPEEQHAQLVAAIQAEQNRLQQTGRPTWQ